MKTLVSIDGAIVPAEEAKISIFDRGFLYGDSVFEVYRSYGDHRFLEREHLERLERSAAIVGIELPAPLALIAEEIAALHEAFGHGDAYLRLMITRGEGPLGIDPRAARSPRRVLFAAPLRLPPPALYQEGASLITLSGAAPRSYTAAAGAKASNYLANLLAQREASERGAHEALFIDESGGILEGATSNLFIVHQGALHTPALESGILPGITRAIVLEIARGLGLEAREGRVDRALLKEADEVFITSSVRELLPIAAIDGEPVGSGQPGAITRRLHSAYRQRIEDSRTSR